MTTLGDRSYHILLDIDCELLAMTVVLADDCAVANRISKIWHPKKRERSEDHDFTQMTMKIKGSSTSSVELEFAFSW